MQRERDSAQESEHRCREALSRAEKQHETLLSRLYAQEQQLLARDQRQTSFWAAEDDIRSVSHFPIRSVDDENYTAHGIKRTRSAYEQDLDSGLGDMERSSSRDAMPPPPPPPASTIDQYLLQEQPARQANLARRPMSTAMLPPSSSPFFRGGSSSLRTVGTPRPEAASPTRTTPQRSHRGIRTAYDPIGYQLMTENSPRRIRQQSTTAIRGGRVGEDARTTLPPGLQSAMREIQRTRLRGRTWQPYRSEPSTDDLSTLATQQPSRSHLRLTDSSRTSYDSGTASCSDDYIPQRRKLSRGHDGQTQRHQNGSASSRHSYSSAYRPNTVRAMSSGLANDIYSQQSLRRPSRDVSSVLRTPFRSRGIRR